MRTALLVAWFALVACESKPAVVPEAGPTTTIVPSATALLPAPVPTPTPTPSSSTTAAAQCSAAADCHATNPCGVYAPSDCGPLAQPTPPITRGCPNTIATHHCECAVGRCVGVRD